VAVELVAGLVRSLRVVFATFAEDVGAEKPNNLPATLMPMAIY
jgi:hypothetical protein